MRPRIGFYGWGIQKILAEYEKALREGTAHVRLTPMHDDILVTGVDVGSPGGDHTAYTGMRGGNVEFVIIDDPYAEEHTYEGEFHVVSPREAMSEMAKLIKFEEALPRAKDVTVRNKGPQPRTKYPRRR
jgi:hypothetical protein